MRHKHRYVEGVIRTPRHEPNSYCRCGATRPGEWTDEEQAMWYVTIRLAYLTCFIDFGTEDMNFFNLWSLSVLRGS